MSSAIRYTVLGLLIFAVPKGTAVLLGASKDDLDRLLPEYEIVHPVVVSSGGDFIAYDLKNAEAHTNRHYVSRRKRSSEDTETIKVIVSENNFITRLNKSIDVQNDMFYDKDNETLFDVNIPATPSQHRHSRRRSVSIKPPLQRRYLHFNVSGFGSRFHLRVETKDRLIAPGAKSVSFTPDGVRIEKELSPGCLFFGKIPHHPRSKVAISNCNGLVGLIQTENDEYFIEPLENRRSVDEPQRHVIYRRSALTNTVINGKRMEGERVRRDADLRDSYESLANSVENMLESSQVSINKQKRHTKRNDYNIEILLTADSEVVNFHGREHVESYLLTLINIVDEIYHDSSLGEHINIVLSRLYQLDEETSSSLILEDNPSTSLKNVCKWAHHLHQTDPGPFGRLPDHAIFLTRRRFGPAGYAHVSGMCHALRSCSLNLEDGFSSAFVIAHETGHVLGMEHDGEGNKCDDETSMGSIMAPLVQAAFHRFHWSRCSQQELKANLRNFACLRDDPHAPDWGPTPVYPGVNYSLDDQCRFDFGQSYRQCTVFYNINPCASLWCSPLESPQLCKSKRGPPLDGTECGENMWCFKGHCVWRHQRQRAVDGNWGSWSSYRRCSRTCGTGVMYRSRTCDNPAPSNGGRECVGKNVDYGLCNTRPCGSGGDFRAEQCRYRNNEVEYKHQRHKWLPYEPFQDDLKCDLYCVSKKTNDVVTMGDIVADGTLCSYDDPHGICIQGECVEVGCDRVIGSSLREDDCGICGGDGRQCRNINGRLNKRTTRKVNNYMKLYKIPKGSRHIRIQELASSDNSNLIALKSRADKRYFLNIKSKRISEDETPHRLINAGTMWHYESRNGVETITARGPINSDVILMILVQQRNVRMSVRYSYILHMNNAPAPRDKYQYEIKRWTPCSVTCGVGHKRAKFGCRSVKGRKWVGKKNCRGKPPRTNRSQRCNVVCRMPARWVPGEWSPCSRTCGSQGIQERNITCHRANSRGQAEVVGDRMCLAEARLPTRKTCQPRPCPPQWRTGPWSTCSQTCSEGRQRRQVICKAPGKSRTSDDMCAGDKPAVEQICEIAPCGVEDDRTSTSETATAAATVTAILDEPCDGDKSVFCIASTLAQYCSLPSYRNVCCASCRNFVRENGGSEILAGQPAIEKQPNVAFEFTFANLSISENDHNHDDDSMSSSIDGADVAHPRLVRASPRPIDSRDVMKSDNVPDDVTIEEMEEDLDVVDGEENDGYYEDSMTTEYLDSEDNLEEFIHTLPPRNSTQPPTSSSDVMLAHERVTTIAVMLPAPATPPSRRRRSIAGLYPVLLSWSDCKMERECGVGLRNSVFSCWNSSNKTWVSLNLCSDVKNLTTVCRVPCYVRAKSVVQVFRRSFIFRPSSECREVKETGLGPRTNISKCRGISRKKKYEDRRDIASSYTDYLTSHPFTQRRKLGKYSRQKRNYLDGS